MSDMSDMVDNINAHGGKPDHVPHPELFNVHGGPTEPCKCGWCAQPMLMSLPVQSRTADTWLVHVSGLELIANDDMALGLLVRSRIENARRQVIEAES